MSQLFSPFKLREVSFKNRLAVSPMSQYRALDGYTSDWHMVHLGRFAIGGSALVYAEATAVEKDGRRTHGDLGIWDDAHIDGLKMIARFIEQEGAVPGIQLGHAGRKASERRPWDGETPAGFKIIEVYAAHGFLVHQFLSPIANQRTDAWGGAR